MKICTISICLILSMQSAFSSTAKVNQTSNTLTSTVQGNLGPGCHIKMQAPEGSTFAAAYSFEPGGAGGLRKEGLKHFKEIWYLGFRCYRAEDDSVKNGWAIYENGFWQPKHSDAWTQLTELKAFQFYPVNSKNSTGWAITADDIIGDEKFRKRKISYCLIKGLRAICGSGDMGYLRDFKRDKKADLTPLTLNLLRTVQFLENDKNLNMNLDGSTTQNLPIEIEK